MKARTLLQTTGLKPTELRALVGKSYGGEELVSFQDMIIALIASTLLRSYSQYAFSLMLYFQHSEIKDTLRPILDDIEKAVARVQDGKKDRLLPVLLVNVVDSRYIGIATDKGPAAAVWDIEAAEIVDDSVYKWMWMSLVMNFSTLLLRSRNYMQQFPNVGIKKIHTGAVVATYLDQITADVVPES